MPGQSELVEELVWLSASGNVDAQYKLGMKLIQGDAVDKNKEKGIEWLKLAAMAGHQKAQMMLEKLQ